MKDRFKFRVWKGLENRMVDNVTHLNPLLLDESLSEEAKYNVLMQCTGLKDKNGKLIYEGDIVTYEWLTPLGKVWRNDGKYIVEWLDGFCLLSNIARYDIEHGTKRNVEIIGNIYENPELLEQTKADTFEHC